LYRNDAQMIQMVRVQQIDILTLSTYSGRCHTRAMEMIVPSDATVPETLHDHWDGLIVRDRVI